MASQLTLPARIEGAAIDELQSQLLTHRQADLDLGGAEVERINGLGVELLLSAFDTWEADGMKLRLFDPSPILIEVFDRINEDLKRETAA